MLFLVSLLLPFFANGQLYQFEWDCNHDSIYTTDVCYAYGASQQVVFICDGTDSITSYYYTDGSCSNDGSGNPYTVETSDESSDTFGLFQCDQSVACDYATIRGYSNGDCTGDSYVDTPYIINQCYYTDEAVSFIYRCLGNNVFETTAFTSGDCSGDGISTSVDYSDLGTTEYCAEVCHQLNYIK